MPIELTPDLPRQLVPLAWLIGSWAGAGVMGYPDVDDAQVGQEIDVTHDGRPFLSYTSRTWLLDGEGGRVRPLGVETGYWRVPGEPRDDGTTELEVLLVHPTGIAEIYLGAVKGPRIDLATDLVARTGTAQEYTAATRLYGLVEGDLLWALDMAARGQPLRSHLSARLKRLPAS